MSVHDIISNLIDDTRDRWIRTCAITAKCQQRSYESADYNRACRDIEAAILAHRSEKEKKREAEITE